MSSKKVGVISEFLMNNHIAAVRRLFVSLLMVVSPIVYAAEAAKSFISVQLENDSFSDYSDSNYTHGFELSLLRAETPPEWLSTVAGWVPFYESIGTFHLVNYSLGQKVFTPGDKQATVVVVDDRPYAGYLFASAAVLAPISHGESYDGGNMLEVQLGVVGPSALGEATQNSTHDLLGYGSAQGWDNQLHDELALGVSYSRIWRIVHSAGEGLEYGVNPHLTVALGNVQTYAAAGLMFRLGDNLRRDINPPNVRPGFPGLSYFKSIDGVDWYGFAGYEARWVGRDIFLDGNTFVDSHRVEKESLVGDLQYGVVFIHRDIRLSISRMQRSKEFKTQQGHSHYTAFNVSLLY